MSPTNAILLLTLVGFLMLACEVFVPGMVLGTLGMLCLLAAVAFAYTSFGAATGTLVLAGVSIVTMIGFVTWMFAFPHTAIGRRIMLRTSLDVGEGDRVSPAGDLIGQQGEAITPLRPSGKARFGERKLDVVAETGFIETGEKIIVIAQENTRVIVRLLA